MTIVWADTETFSEQDIKGGAARYARDPSTRIQLFSYAFDDGEVKLWVPEEGEKLPSDLRDAFRDPSCTFYFHNAYFDRQIIENCLGIVLPIERYRCVMARALSHSLPASLENLGVALGLPADQAKMREGKKLVQLFCKPNKDGTFNNFLTHPEEWEQYKVYCKQDTAAMRTVCKMIPHWNYKNFELKLWYLDQKVNDRGLQVDVELAKAATALVGVEKEYLDARTKELTRGAVGSATQRDAIMRFILDEYGVDMPDMQKATVQDFIASSPHDNLKELLKIRRDSTTTSSAKYKALLGAVCDDGRLRGTIQYAGASRTLRDGGRLFQPQNLPRPTGIYAGNHELIDEGIQMLKDNIADIFVPNVMELMSSALRSVIVAAPGKKLVIADLSSIEARVLAWLAGEEWELDVARRYDQGEGADAYRVTYAKAFGIAPEDVTKDQRQIGKVMVLFLGFAGGVGAFVTGAATYHIDLKAMAEQVLPTVPKRILTEAGDFYDWIVERAESAASERIEKELAKSKELAAFNVSEMDVLTLKLTFSTLWVEHYKDPTHGLERGVFIACDSLKRLWRESHPATTKFWYDLKDAVIKAVNDPSNIYRVGKHIEVTRSKDWLRITLPSGHNLLYPMMKVSGDGGLSFMGEHPLSKNWERLPTFHGRLAENCLGAATRVLTRNGVKQIVAVTSEDEVWDGIEWVKTDGVICQGYQRVGYAGGVCCTPEHLFLVTEGVWKKASELETEAWSAAYSYNKSELLEDQYQLDEHRYLSLIHIAHVYQWQESRKQIPVYDLLNCGKNSRFAIVTDYGILISHNCVQAVARDIFKFGEYNAEEAGYSIVLPVHDENVTEVPDTDDYSVAELSAIMTQNPPWAADIPLAAAGFETYRYRKE